MKSFFRGLSGVALLGLGTWLLAGCATMGPPGPVYVHTRMSQSVFLDIGDQKAKTVFIDCRDSSDTDSGVGPHLKDALRRRLLDQGYTVVYTPGPAFYVLQVNVRYIGERDSADMGTTLGAGFGGAVIGGLVGGRQGEGLGMLAGLIAGSTVRDVHYTLVTDVQITERDDRDDQYMTRVASYAGQTNLEFSEAEPALVDQQAPPSRGSFKGAQGRA